MKVISFIKDGVGLRPVEIESSLVKGLPKIQFLGLPDSQIKESVHRIVSALKHQGYQLPKSKQVIVQLRPNHLKKTSNGLDLAIAASILWETGQLPKPEVEKVALYGELTLKGEVLEVNDFEDIIERPDVDMFYTSPVEHAPFDLYTIKSLKAFEQAVFCAQAKQTTFIQRPKLPELMFSKQQAELIKIIALGEHHALFAGPPGTGKSTMGLLVHTLLRKPMGDTFLRSRQISKHFGIKLNWRPLVSPHHTATSLSMIGGGNLPKPGEITRAHGGLLLMDELLEFSPKVQEALREPLEMGHITISRTGHVSLYPADFQLIATTNLCPCGYLIPDKNFDCQGRPSVCRNYVQKLSGPMMDRFSIMAFSHEWGGEQTVSSKEMLTNLLLAWEFQKKRKQVIANQKLDVRAIEASLGKFEREVLLKDLGGSLRRYHSLLKVAQTCADLECSKNIEKRHIRQAQKLTIHNFNRLKQETLGWRN